MQLLSLKPYLGKGAKRYYGLIEELNETKKSNEMLAIIEQLKAFSSLYPALMAIYEQGLKNLAKSIQQTGR